MFDFLRVASSYFPLEIKEVIWVDDNLIISGEAWSFSTLSVWRVSKGSELLFTCWDDPVEKGLMRLVGLSLENISWININQPIDPSLIFTDGSRLDVFSSFAQDPWVFRLPSGVTYVGNS